ncbi:hypothetical protein GCM10022214_26160 [Actinomadura miaoliensis]|uniref:Uncharacterized protein n=1 Tax=Actinomadura miaoliensis TaxID=430685 RepID=A0ABP7VMN5_9ACTN
MIGMGILRGDPVDTHLALSGGGPLQAGRHGALYGFGPQGGACAFESGCPASRRRYAHRVPRLCVESHRLADG